MHPLLRIVLLAATATVAVSCNEAQVSGPGGGGPGPAGTGPAGSAGPGTGPGSGSGGGSSGVTLPDPPKTPVASPDAGALQCAAEAFKAEIVPLDLMLLVDSSSSMTGSAGMRSKWQTAQSALKSFVSDPKSAGLNMGLQFFPADTICMTDGDCFTGAPDMGRYCTGRQVCAGPGGPAANAVNCGPQPILIIGPRNVANCPGGTTCQPFGNCSASGAGCTNGGQACAMGGGMCEVPPKTCIIGGTNLACDEASYNRLAVPIVALPMGQGTLMGALDRKAPQGATPMGPAVRGVLAQLRARVTADPGRKVALILASDGLPGGCQRNDIPSIAADVAGAFMAQPSIPTYVIGVFSPTELAMVRPQLDQVAMGGGTGQAYVLSATDDLNMRLLDALAQIRGAALACEYRIPAMPSRKLDFAKVNVRHIGPAGPENVPYVERVDGCDATRGGWYYDYTPTLSRVA